MQTDNLYSVSYKKSESYHEHIVRADAPIHAPGHARARICECNL